ncbi:Trehalose-6-P synthase/phosphatase complex synthase subunit [Salvia divinorum]|uniref:Trehalose-6-P synthase/phosphatase complex synthase subunit n=1 Tax=Salvia divinorum TaxID=28513 RepID=A0ABD1HWD8_SALDI
MKVAIPSCAYVAIATTCLLGMGDQVSKQDFDWIAKEPHIVVASSIICRLMDDIVGEEFEQKTSAIECYIKQYGVSKEAACAELQQQVKNAWKDMNRECLEPRPASMKILMRIFNLGRAMHLLYSKGDGYSDPNRSKELIKMVLVEPLKI